MNEDDVNPEIPVDEEALWRLVTALASSVTPLDVAEAFTREGARAVGASFANMAILSEDGSSVRVMHRPTFNPAVVAQRGTFDLSAPTPACEAIRSGVPILLGSL